MSFTNPRAVQTNSRCWARNYRWAGGMKNTKDAQGNIKSELRAEIRSWNKEAESNDILPPEMKLAVVGFTAGISGYNGEKGDKSTRYYSNEVISSFEQPFTVFSSNKVAGTKKIYKNQIYSTFKEGKPKGCDLVNFIYFYNFDTKKIDRFEVAGCARTPWFNLDKKDGILHKRWLLIKQGDPVVNGTVTFVPPIYDFGDMFTQAEIDEIVNSEAYKAYGAFEDKIAAGKFDNGSFENDIDQTPEYYDGEDSQELPDASTAQPANVTDLSGVPF